MGIMSALRNRTLILLLAMLLLHSNLFSDVIMVNRSMFAPVILEIDIRDDHIIVDWEIETKELFAFPGLLPDELLSELGLGDEPWEDRLNRFFQEDWPLKADGRILEGHLISLEGRSRRDRDELTGDVTESGDEGIPVLACRVIYPLEVHPDVIELSGPPLSSDGYPATIGFLTSHLGVPVSEFYFLSQGQTLILDWEDPWYSAWTNERMTKAFNSPINLFLYIESREVRTEVVIRPSDLANWVDLEIEPNQPITPERREDILDKASGFLEGQINLRLDGGSVPSALDRIQFLERSRRGSFIPDPGKDLDPYSIYIGAIYVSPISELPDTAELPWNLFTPKRPFVSAAAVDEAGPLSTQIIPEFPSLTWTNFLTNPSDRGLLDLPVPARPLVDVILVFVPGIAGLILIILGLAGVLRRQWSWPAGGVLVLVSLGLLTAGITGMAPVSSPGRIGEEDRIELTGALLTNIYRSFDFREEGDIYDALSTSARGDILQSLYLDTRKAMEIRELGGARVKVTEVSVASAEPLPGEDGTWLSVDWTVTGTVGHWGHIHTRGNRYTGDLRLDANDGAWKISGFHIREEERIQ
jgi:hypothetical protein